MNTILIVSWFLVKEFTKGFVIAGVLRILIAHLFRSTVSFEGFVRSCLFGGVVLSVASLIWLFLP